MSSYDPNAGQRRRRTDRRADPMQPEPSMSAPSPMPGRPAATYVKPQPAPTQPQAAWEPQRAEPHPQPVQHKNAYKMNQPMNQQTNPQMDQQRGWHASYPQGYGYYANQPQPSQGVPAQAGQTYGGWQGSAYPQQPMYAQSMNQQPGRGWSQQPANQPQNGWQGGYTPAPWNGNGYTHMYEEPRHGGNTPSNGSGGGNGGHGGRGRGGDNDFFRANLFKLIAAVAVVVAAVVIMVALFVREKQIQNLQAEVMAYNDRYCQGVYVDGIHLGGMTAQEALAAVKQSAQQKCDEWKVQLVTSSGEYVGELNASVLGLTVHVEDALNAAWLQGHTGADIYARKAEMDALLETPYTASTALPSSDEAVIDALLSDVAAQYYIPATDAYALYDPALTNPFSITAETNGRWLDVGSVKAQVYDMISRMESGVVTIEPSVLYPEVTAAQLRKQTTLIASAYTKISTTSEEGRNKNIERACDLINGVEIKPGQNFSFNGIVGERSAKNGFYQAIEYAYSKETVGYGGGVCQVSSTIYWAAVRANMQIVKREQHALRVGYTEFGFDATVNYTGKKIDFVFKNTSESSIYIITKVVKRPSIDKSHYLVLCEIYGPAPETGVTYDIVAVTKEIPIPEATIIPDKTGQHVVYTDDKPYTVAGKVGYEVDSYKVKYVNGEEVERTFMYHDTYSPVQPVTYVGVNERPLPTVSP